MIARHGLGLITSSNFYVPQVNLPGRMARFVTPAGIPVSVSVPTLHGLGQTRRTWVVRRRRGLGRDDSVDIPIITDAPPVLDTSLPGDLPGSSIPTTLSIPGASSSTIPIASTGGFLSQTVQSATSPMPASSSVTSAALNPFLTGGKQQTPGTIVNITTGGASGATPNPLAALTSGNMLPILLIGGGLLMVMMMAKKR